MSEPKHAKLSASGSPTWMVCSAAPAMQRQLPDRGSTYAAEGTAAHEIAARCLKQEVDAEHFAGVVIEVESVSGDTWVPKIDGASSRDPECLIQMFECDSEMVDNVQIFVDAVRSRKGDELIVERKVDYSYYVPKGFGTVDAGSVVIAEKRLYVDDLKYGANVKVDALVHPDEQLYALGTRGNPQQLLYGIAMLLEVDLFYEIETIVVGIHQPRMEHVDEFEISREDLIEWAEKIVRPAALRANEANTSFSEYFAPGEKTCQWCNAKNLCAYRQRWMLEAAAADFEPVPMPDDLLDLADEIQAAGEMSALTPMSEMAARIPRLRELGKWADKVRDYLREEAEAGVTIPGYKLVDTLGDRVWADKTKAEGAIKREVGAADAFTKKLLTPPALEKVLTKKLGKKKLAEEHRLLSDKFVTRPPGKPSLVPVDDPRPATASAADGFDAVVESDLFPA